VPLGDVLLVHRAGVQVALVLAAQLVAAGVLIIILLQILLTIIMRMIMITMIKKNKHNNHIAIIAIVLEVLALRELRVGLRAGPLQVLVQVAADAEVLRASGGSSRPL